MFHYHATSGRSAKTLSGSHAQIRRSFLQKIGHIKGKKRFVARNTLCANLPRKIRQKRITDFFGNRENPRTAFVKIDENKIVCYQSNNQKRIESCEKLAHYCDKLDHFLVLGQEPSTYGCGITGLNNRHTKIHAATTKVRAYIYAHRDFNIWPIDNLTIKDVATALLDPNA